MGYLRQVILANSAGYPYAQVRIDGHCDIAGGSGEGKTTLANSILFPFVVEDKYISMSKGEKDCFSDYYFSKPNSFIVYEVINDINSPYCVLINRVQAALHFHLISAPYNERWLFDENGLLRRSWDEVRAQFNGISVQTKTTREEFNRIFLGRDGKYMEQYSIINSGKGNDLTRLLLSSIFKNRPFTQDVLKESLVESAVTSNMLDLKGINLNHYKMNLSEFKSRLNDIRLVTRTGKDGKTAVADIADDIFKLKSEYETQAYEMSCIPAKLAYSLSIAREKFKVLTAETSEATSRKDAVEQKRNAEEATFSKTLNEISEALGTVKANINMVTSVEEKYKEKGIDDIDALVAQIRNKKHYLREKSQIENLMNAINKDFADIEKMRDAAVSENLTHYQHRQNEIDKAYNDAVSALVAEKNKLGEEVDRQRHDLEEEYKKHIGTDWSNTQRRLIDELLSITKRIEAYETIEEVRSEVEKLEVIQEEVGLSLSLVASRRCGENATLEEMKTSAVDTITLLYGHLDDKTRLEKEKMSKLTEIETAYTSRKNQIETQRKTLADKHRKDKEANKNECEAKEAQINADYNARLTPDDNNERARMLELKKRLDAVDRILETIDNFQGCALDDKTRWLDRKDDFIQKRNTLNDEKIAVGEKKKATEEAYKGIIGEIEARIQTLKQRKRDLESEIQAADRFIEQHPRIKTLAETCEPAQTERTPKSIIDDYAAISDSINDIKEKLPASIQRLYAPGMLSRIDTFDLGIRKDSRLSSFDDFMLVADKLEARLLGTNTGVSIDEFLRNEATLWLDCLKDVHSDLQPVEDTLLRIHKNCHTLNRFIKENNHTTCIDYIKLYIDEQSSVTDLVKILRDISSFYDENQNILGYDNLFSLNDEPVNDQAMELLERFSEELSLLDNPIVEITSMFDVRIDFSKWGHEVKNVTNLNDPGSKGESILLKAMLNIALLMLILTKTQAANTRIPILIDEMNELSATNLNELKKYADKAGMYLIGSGQHHTSSALDFSYNVWSVRDSQTSPAKKYISMDAANNRKDDGTVQQ